MPTMNINVTPEIAEFVSSEMILGNYASASELVRDALHLLRRERDADEERLQILRRKLDIGLDQAERGDFSNRSVREIAASVLADEEE